MSGSSGSELDRVAREAGVDALLDRLADTERRLAESEADRAARLDVIHARDRTLIEMDAALRRAAEQGEALHEAIAALRLRVERGDELVPRMADVERSIGELRDGIVQVNGVAAGLRQAIAESERACTALREADERLQAALTATIDHQGAAFRDALDVIEARVHEADRLAARDREQAETRSQDVHARMVALEAALRGEHAAMVQRLTTTEARLATIEARLARTFMQRLRDRVRGR